MTVNELLSRIDSRELTEWAAFFKVKAEIEKEAEKPPVDAQITAGLKGYRRP